MSRYIDADALKEKMLKYGFRSADQTVTEFVEDILPTADVVEVKHGKWIEDGYQGYPCVCSVCGIGQDIKAKFLFSFCPNCGAEMRERREDAD